jgi:hypothetical protein
MKPRSLNSSSCLSAFDIVGSFCYLEGSSTTTTCVPAKRVPGTEAQLHTVGGIVVLLWQELFQKGLLMLSDLALQHPASS